MIFTVAGVLYDYTSFSAFLINLQLQCTLLFELYSYHRVDLLSSLTTDNDSSTTLVLVASRWKDSHVQEWRADATGEG